MTGWTIYQERNTIVTYVLRKIIAVNTKDLPSLRAVYATANIFTWTGRAGVELGHSPNK